MANSQHTNVPNIQSTLLTNSQRYYSPQDRNFSIANKQQCQLVAFSTSPLTTLGNERNNIRSFGLLLSLHHTQFRNNTTVTIDEEVEAAGGSAAIISNSLGDEADANATSTAIAIAIVTQPCDIFTIYGGGKFYEDFSGDGIVIYGSRDAGNSVVYCCDGGYGNAVYGAGGGSENGAGSAVNGCDGGGGGRAVDEDGGSKCSVVYGKEHDRGSLACDVGGFIACIGYEYGIGRLSACIGDTCNGTVAGLYTCDGGINGLLACKGGLFVCTVVGLFVCGDGGSFARDGLFIYGLFALSPAKFKSTNIPTLTGLQSFRPTTTHIFASTTIQLSHPTYQLALTSKHNSILFCNLICKYLHLIPYLIFHHIFLHTS